MTKVFTLQSKFRIDIGKKRDSNQDFATCFEPRNPRDLEKSGCLYLVADGVAGVSKGGKASQFAAEKVMHEYYLNPDADPMDRLSDAFRKAGAQIFDYAEARGIRMATTLIGAVVLGEELILANVGDSRAYLIRDGEAQQMTEDHSEVAEKVRKGILTPEEAKTAKGRNRILRSIGSDANVLVDVFEPIKLMPGDRVLLCSDGLTRYADEGVIADLASDGDPEDVVNDLVDYANQSGGKDNIAVLLVEIGQPGRLEPPTFFQKPVLGPSETEFETVEWEMPPDFLSPETQEKSSAKELITNPWFISTIILVIIIMSGGVFFLFRFLSGIGKDRSETVKEHSYVSMTSEPTHDDNSVIENKTLPSQTVFPTEITPTLEKLKTITPVIETQEISDEEIKVNTRDCIYVVQDGDKLILIIDILYGFNIESKPQDEKQKFYDSIICVPDHFCEYDPKNPHYLQPDWYLLFPEVPIVNEKYCSAP